MEKTIDARGHACPKPLVMARDMLKTLTKDDKLNVVVDNLISAQNLEKMAVQMDMPSEKIQQGSDYVVSLFVKNSFIKPQQEEIKCEVSENPTSNTVVVISSDTMGESDEKLGKILIKGFIYSLTNLEKLPKSVIFYNGGVKLLVKASEAIEDLQRLQSAGVEILACGTCVEFYGLKDKLALGEIVNMLTIVEKQMNATKVVKP